jgi:hypothetical protein
LNCLDHADLSALQSKVRIALRHFHRPQHFARNRVSSTIPERIPVVTNSGLNVTIFALIVPPPVQVERRQDTVSIRGAVIRAIAFRLRTLRANFEFS